MRVLFVDQGRAGAGTAMGHVRVRHALRAGLAQMGSPIDADEVQVPPFSALERSLARPIPGLASGGFRSVRWHLARSRLARGLIGACIEHRGHDVVHLTTDQVSLLLGGIQDEVPVVLSLDVVTVDWVRMLRGLPTETAAPIDLRALAFLERRALERAPLAIAWTDTVAASIRRLAPRSNVAVLHPGIDLREYRPRAGPRPEGPLRVLFVGGRWEAKGGPDLLAALRLQLGRTVRLDVVTTGEVAAVNGMTVHSARPGSDTVARLFASADIFCLPTSVDAVPWVVIEAMASGVPVIATNVGSIPEIVGEAGLLVEPGDGDALSEALTTLLESSELRSSMGEAGRARAEERYDALANTPILVERLRDVVGLGAGR